MISNLYRPQHIEKLRYDQAYICDRLRCMPDIIFSGPYIACFIAWNKSKRQAK